jgi:hypothetical protein
VSIFLIADEIIKEWHNNWTAGSTNVLTFLAGEQIHVGAVFISKHVTIFATFLDRKKKEQLDQSAKASKQPNESEQGIANDNEIECILPHFGNPSSQSVARSEQRKQGRDQIEAGVEARDPLLANFESEPSESADEEYIWNNSIFCILKQKGRVTRWSEIVNCISSFATVFCSYLKASTNARGLLVISALTTNLIKENVTFAAILQFLECRLGYTPLASVGRHAAASAAAHML